MVGHTNYRTSINHKHPLYADAAEQKSTQAAFHSEIQHLQLFIGCNNIFPELVPKLNIDKDELTKAVHESLKSTGHTRKIPLSIAIDILGGAIEWVMRFGPSIVDATVFYAKSCKDIDMGSAWKTNIALDEHFQSTKSKFETQQFGNCESIPLYRALNITDLNAQKLPKDGISVAEVMQSFIGACVTVLGMLKPMRVGEICKLRRDCLGYEDLVGGALIEHISEKSGHSGVNDMISRPIPYIVARAILLLRRLGNELENVYEVAPSAPLLFYFPLTKGLQQPQSRVSSARIDGCLDAFSRRLALPKDEFGRSWQIRVHETRKFYLMTLVHHEGESARNTASYMAGHLGSQTIDEYLKGDIPTDEILMYKAECITDKLIRLEEHMLEPEENQGLLALHADVKRVFKVDAIRGRAEKDYYRVISQLIADKSIELKTYTITIITHDGNIVDNDFAVKYLENKDAKFTS